ncbi:MAG: hypothetical protein LBT65_04870 [Synergistaceae bacterium]|nr:hypothetical protein [Synergistaceae bacterium]
MKIFEWRNPADIIFDGDTASRSVARAGAKAKRIAAKVESFGKDGKRVFCFTATPRTYETTRGEGGGF